MEKYETGQMISIKNGLYGIIGVYTDSKDKEWEVSSYELKKVQRKQLKEEGEIIIKRYK